ncbi:hypothetical protein GCM10011506_17010 [Marivirga lumbricoides]|uniref:D-serine dehydratase-like domain-containing protein n=1 Tax=Marivirga lumbricoides TaxID=1046115 RepID=A0ABQ1LZF3_9BACT|nr:hypothetical protein GCM10011506_17010 [Marivirga lumbricoides]
MNVVQPTLLLDEEKCKKNILKMVNKAQESKSVLRPHFKTHQSAEVGEWFKEAGIEKCAVSSLGMAEYFAHAGWKDITVAFPLNVLEKEKVNRLAKTITLNLCIESTETARILSDFVQHQLNVFVEVDAGYNRSGISSEDYEEIAGIIDIIQQNKLLHFTGFLQHAGHTYQAKGKSEIDEIHAFTSDKMRSLKNHFQKKYPEIIVSNGDTPTCSVSENFEGVDEMRPGNFIFYDVMQAEIGSCSYEEIAVALACPVVAKYPERNEIVVYGGAVHFSKDRIENESGTSMYGLVAQKSAYGWGNPTPGLYMKKLSQEHGTIHATDEFIRQTKIGDILYILPIHSCLTANLMGKYFTLEGRELGMYRFGF